MPQGSILGSILFFILIKGIVADIDATTKLFAGDTSLFVIVHSLDIAANILNRDLEKIHQWATTLIVKFSPQKTETILVFAEGSLSGASGLEDEQS